MFGMPIAQVERTLSSLEIAEWMAEIKLRNEESKPDSGKSLVTDPDAQLAAFDAAGKH